MATRFIKETICKSQDINKLSYVQEVLFYRILVNCDDDGTMDASPAVIRVMCFPLRLDRVAISNVSDWTEALERAGLIATDTVDHRRIRVTNWEKYQQKYNGGRKNSYSNSYSLSPSLNKDTNKEITNKASKDTKYEVKDGVFLTSKETDELLNILGEHKFNELIEAVSLYQLSTGKKYKSHYHTVLNWARRDTKNVQTVKHVRQPGPGGILNGGSLERIRGASV